MKIVCFFYFYFLLGFMWNKEEGKPVVQDIKELVFASSELEWTIPIILPLKQMEF